MMTKSKADSQRKTPAHPLKTEYTKARQIVIADLIFVSFSEKYFVQKIYLRHWIMMQDRWEQQGSKMPQNLSSKAFIDSLLSRGCDGVVKKRHYST